MATTVRVHVELRLTHHELKAFGALCASEVRPPGGMAARIVAAHLARPAPRRPLPLGAARGERHDYRLQLRLTAEQRRALKARARAEGRTLSNYVTALVVRACRQAN